MSTATKPTQALANEEFRLPTNVRPTHYDLTIRTDLEKLVFDGFVKIDLDVGRETSSVVLNTAELDIRNVTLHSEALQTEQVDTSRAFDEKLERVALQFATPLPAGSKARLTIAFSGKISGSMVGYYHSSWQENGKTKYYTLTQMEPTTARRAFPCWDEPALKATFDVTMISRADTVSLSNMSVASEEVYTALANESSTVASLAQWMSSLVLGDKPEDKWKITRFTKSPPMSTYLVAYANGYFKYIESSYTSPVSGTVRPLRVYATPDLIHQAQFGLDVKRKVMPIYERLFDIEYPLPKLDTLVARDFDAGAMENWGLITGRTSAVLVDPERADIAAKKRVAVVMSHECAHMWFGDITTMEWWTYLYLNEGFATLMGEVIVLDKVFPEWKVYANFITEHLEDALHLDGKLSSHAVEVDCPDANEINQIFDSLSYAKAASVLRMLSDYIGEEQFVKGVSLYLKKHLYGNSVSRDLWVGISEAAGKDVTTMMTTWVEKIGYPVLTVTETADGIRVRQDRFLETGPAEAKDNQTVWTVPLSVVTPNGIDRSLVLSSRESTFKVDTSKPFKLNANTVGVYRVLYSPERLTAIATEAAKHDSIFTLEDRMGLVNDAMTLSQAGFAKVSDALNVVQALRDEEEYVVWNAITTNVEAVHSMFWEQSQIVEQLDTFRRALLSPLVNKLGYQYLATDSADTSLLRTLAICGAAEAGDETVIKHLQSWFAHFKDTGDDSHIPPDLVAITFQTAVKHGGSTQLEQMKQICANPKNPAIGIHAMYAMASVNEAALATEVLDYAMKNARDQDLIYYFRGMGRNIQARHAHAKWFRDNYEALYKRYENNFQLKDLLEEAFSRLSSQQDYDQTAEFFRDKDTSRYRMMLEQALESIKARNAFVQRSEADVRDWLGQQRI